MPPASAQRAKRTYTKRARAEREAATRARILSATLELWAELGPADTTITAVASRARVQRLTVYRHFPDETALARAACLRFEESFPVPDPAEQAATGDRWREAAGKRSGAAKARYESRALYWYEKGVDGLAGPARLKVATAIDVISKSLHGGDYGVHPVVLRR